MLFSSVLNSFVLFDVGHKGWFVYSEKVYQDKLKIFNCN